jgi:FtsP/CotA-like multicopper oxidase with cupredoxin domain
MMVVNGQYPGPLIQANWGDWIEVVFHNNLKEGTAMHWHGMLQKDTPWSDGVPGISQCPIVPGEKLTYRFRASSYGTTWYHSHYSAQYSMGLSGPMIIHGPKHYEYDADLGPVLLSDLFHREYHDIVKHIFVTEIADAIPYFIPDTLLINGKNEPSTCNGCEKKSGLSSFRFEKGM